MILNRLRARLMWAMRELRDWASPVTNPFMAQFIAHETRRPPLWSALICMVAWLYAFLLITASAAQNPYRDFAGDAALVWIGAALVAALLTRTVRCMGLIRVEVLKNRFEPLQLLPLSSARRAWLWCAPVTLLALTTFGLALPALLWGLGSRRLAPHDALGLGFIALVCSWGTPLWRPHVWRAQLDKAGASAAGATDGFAAPPSPGGISLHWLGGAFLALIALAGAGVGAEAPAAYWEGLPAHLRATGAEWWLSWPLFGARWLTEAQPFFGFKLSPLLIIGPVWVAGVHNSVLRLGAVTAREPYWTPPRALRWARALRLQNWGIATFCFGVVWAGAIGSGWLSDWFVGAPRTTEWALATWWVIALFLGALSAASRWGEVLDAPTGTVTLQSQLVRAARAVARLLAGTGCALIGSCLLGLAWPFGAAWRQILPASLAVAAVWLGAALVTSAGRRVAQAEKLFAWLNRVWFFGGPLLFVALHYFKVDVEALAPQIFFLSPWTLWWTLRQPDISGVALFWPAIAAHATILAASATIVWRARHNIVGAQPMPPTPAFKELWATDEATTHPATTTTWPENDSSPYTGELSSNNRTNSSPPEETLFPYTGELYSNNRTNSLPLGETLSPYTGEPVFHPATPTVSPAATSPADTLESPAYNLPDAALTDDEEADFDEDDDDEAPAAVSVLGRAPLPAPDEELVRLLAWQGRFENPLLLLETRRVVGNGLKGTLQMALILTGAIVVLEALILPAWGLYKGRYPAEFAVAVLGIALSVWCVVPLFGLGGASRSYDQDRVDGSLQMLFLTPLTERDIAVGKLGPHLTRAALMLAFYCPFWLMGLLPALIFRDSIILTIYLLAPFVIASFALRIAAISHWTALKKRKIGTVSVPWSIVVGAIVAVPSEFTLLFAGLDSGALTFALALAALSLVFVAESALFWWLSLRQLRHRRGIDAPVGR